MFFFFVLWQGLHDLEETHEKDGGRGFILSPPFYHYVNRNKRERERIYLICFAHRHNNQIDNTHKKKSLVAKAREHRGTFRLSSRDTP